MFIGAPTYVGMFLVFPYRLRPFCEPDLNYYYVSGYCTGFGDGRGTQIKPRQIQNMNCQLHESKTCFNQLRGLFGKQQPSVRRFNQTLKDFSIVEKERWYQLACFVAMNEWDTITQWYRTFLTNLIKHDWQRFLKYVRETSILGHLAYRLEDERIIKQIFHFISHLPINQRKSFNHLAFVLSLSFAPSQKIEYLADQLRTITMTPEELLDMMGWVEINC